MNSLHDFDPLHQRVAKRLLGVLERFLHVEAVSGIMLLFAAAVALVWANSPAAASYEHLWQLTFSVAIGGHELSQSLHFLINDGLMTMFFLAVGLEIRREMQEGALASLKLAALPLAAAVGGVAVPAAIYVALSTGDAALRGWAVPTATDIAFAIGVLALLGKSIPGSVRILLLALAIIDDIVAVLIIALFYSSGLEYSALPITALGVALVLCMQKIGIGSALGYVIPGSIIWFGLLRTGVHPTLAGVILGLMTPAVSTPTRGGRELSPPVVRVEATLHPWVAYGVMPLFALANAGVSVGGVSFAGDVSWNILLGVFLALVVGKPLGIVLGSWIAVRCRWCILPAGVTWQGVWLVGCLGGIGFTMSIFIASLAFDDPKLLAAAKFAVLAASAVAGVLGLAWGRRVVLESEGSVLGAGVRASPGDHIT